MSCNGVDAGLYAHYAEVFEGALGAVPDAKARVEAFRRKWATGSSGEWSRKYPINCRKQISAAFDKLHSC